MPILPIRAFHLIAALLALLAALLSAAAHAEENDGNATLLVARRGLTDPNFRESVVLLANHGRHGAMGVILNRPLALPLKQLFPGNEGLKSLDENVYFGGPVSRTTLVFVYRAEARADQALPVATDVYMSVSPDLLAQLLRRGEPTKDLRVYAGYAGWASEQLRREIGSGDWYVLKADAKTLFARDPSQLWNDLIGRVSGTRVDNGSRGLEPAATLATR